MGPLRPDMLRRTFGILVASLSVLEWLSCGNGTEKSTMEPWPYNDINYLFKSLFGSYNSIIGCEFRRAKKLKVMKSHCKSPGPETGDGRWISDGISVGKLLKMESCHNWR